jgi:hypothetical protein
MSTQAEIVENLIRLGRAAVRITEVADILLSFKPVWTERLPPRLVRALYQHRLRDTGETLTRDGIVVDTAGIWV